MFGKFRKRLRRRRRRRGSTLVESVLVITLLSLLFWYLFFIADLCMIKVVSDHSANVMARSHAVGFNRRITNRAMRVGMIPVSGHIKNPSTQTLGVNSNVELGQMDESLISYYVQDINPYGHGRMEYQHWDKVTRGITPGDDYAGVITFRTNFRIEAYKSDYSDGSNDYLNELSVDPPERHRISLIPGIWLFLRDNVLNIRGKSKMLNHSDYYLE